MFIVQSRAYNWRFSRNARRSRSQFAGHMAAQFETCNKFKTNLRPGLAPANQKRSDPEILSSSSILADVAHENRHATDVICGQQLVFSVSFFLPVFDFRSSKRLRCKEELGNAADQMPEVCRTHS
jgi:hypothetical protein